MDVKQFIKNKDFDLLLWNLIGKEFDADLFRSIDTKEFLSTLKKIKIAIIGSYTIENIKKYLKFYLISHGFNPEFFFGEYNQYMQELLDENSELYQFSPDVILLTLDHRTFLDDLPFTLMEKSKEEIDLLLEDKLSYLKNLIDVVTKKSAHLIVTNLDPPNYSPHGLRDRTMDVSLKQFIEDINREFSTLISSSNQVTLFDFNSFCSRIGIENLTDSRFYYLGKFLFSPSAGNSFSSELSALINALRGKRRKCLVIDLDNTLWGGVIGEDDVSGISLGGDYPGSVYSDIQKIILNWYRNGVILAINSKNNLDDAKKGLNHPEMILKEEHFACMMINWDDKATNIHRISEELNIGIDSMVFLDDNPAERALVSTTLPQVEVIDFPKDIAELPTILKQISCFDVLDLSDEDKKRGEMYATERKRKEVSKRFTTKEDYLKSLGITISVSEINETNQKRITQLINKTNQFNLRTKRYTFEDINEMKKTDYIYCVSASDKFGESGIVGVIIIKDQCNTYFIDTFLLSCRVMSRGIEQEFLRMVLTTLKDQNKPVRGEYIPTKKNSPVKHLYDTLGFRKESDETYLLDGKIKEVTWIKGDYAWKKK